ncbi:MAG TPA: 3-oxoacyl-[acyl-carrier-protein] synthase III C-terminal domain-containing protein [Verrucomicrobiae bacterium]|jgi:alkylresorcinol/alkylpyrone synthase|nr:3-oxoacyl-[acyl-carrier-protein] synthase III C-terminal domain-containing protein [Verrucomicrobiae bacterium]
MYITGLGTAAPSHCYTQAQCWDALQNSTRFRELTPRSRAILKKVLSGANGITTRHLSLENLNQAFDLTPDALHARFSQNAPLLAAQAAERAFADAQIKPADIDAIVVSTCTGYLCPGLTSYVGERLGLRKDAMTFDLVGQGCGAALPNLRVADALLAAGRAGRVLSVCVEICSAAFYLDDDIGVLISACLFGDGAGAAVLANEPGANRSVKWKIGGSLTVPADREFLRFEQKSGMLRNILAPQVPALAAQHVGKLFADTLARANVDRSQVAGWVLHPGGRDVLAALRDALGLSDRDVRWSEAVLREYGNVSSPSIYFVLQNALNDSVPPGLWWMSSFGAGFSCHGALLEVG